MSGTSNEQFSEFVAWSIQKFLFFLVLFSRFFYMLLYSWSLDYFYWHCCFWQSIPADFYNYLARMAIILRPISNSSNLFSMLLGTVPSAQIRIGITVTFMFHTFSELFSNVQLFVQLFALFHLQPVVCWSSEI